MRYNINTDDFIRLAKEVHGDKYDYSLVKYNKWKEKVKIICPIHGIFEQAPQQHINKKHGCPNCRWVKREETCLNLYGVKNPFQSELFITSEIRKESREKAKNTIKERYNVESISQIEGHRDKVEKTCMERYGTKYYASCDKAKNHMSKVISSKEVQDKTIQTCLNRYGVSYSLCRKDIRKKQKEALNSDSYKQKRKSIGKIVADKSMRTRINNGTMSTSKCENDFYEYLLNHFNKEDIYRNYKSELYPFFCDFYIKSIDVYIELNIHWTHGGHEFNPSSLEDKKKLCEWKNRLNNGIMAYETAINVWTIKDKEKINTAKKNKLNYIIIWNQKELNEYINSNKLFNIY